MENEKRTYLIRAINCHIGNGKIEDTQVFAGVITTEDRSHVAEQVRRVFEKTNPIEEAARQNGDNTYVVSYNDEKLCASARRKGFGETDYDFAFAVFADALDDLGGGLFGNHPLAPYNDQGKAASHE